MDHRSTAAATLNPFKMPTDEEVFILRDEEKRQAALARQQLKYQRVHEKTTWSARIGMATPNTNRVLEDDSDVHPLSATMPTSDIHLPSIERRVKDNMAQYITKKRKLGLARMSLATKRQEIKKLDEEAEHAEKRIQQMQQQLKETEGKFSTFLSNTETEHKTASNRAEQETKAKQEKIQEIKKLSAQIAQVETDKRKNEEQLQQCLEFKLFLDQLAPVDWLKKTVTQLKQEEARRSIQSKLDAKYGDLLTEGLSEAEETERLEQKQRELEAECAKVYKTIADDVEEIDQDDADIILRRELDKFDPDRVPMYFTEPDQILLKFIEIEEGNLFLITTCQEYEEQIEDITSKYKQKKQEMQDLVKMRQAQMESIRRNIQAEQVKLRALEERIARVAPSKNKSERRDEDQRRRGEDDKNNKEEVNTSPSQDQLKALIAEKVKQIYRAAVDSTDDAANLGILGSLTQIEVTLEKKRQEIINSNMDQSFVANVMRARDKARRQATRQELLNKQREERERRSLLALKRSQAPVQKRVGKPVMWRSRPLDNHKREAATSEDNNGNEEDEFFS